MSKLEDVSAERLRDELADVSDAKAAKRLMTAVAYKDGEPVETMRERDGIPMATLYSWLDRPPNLPDSDRQARRADLNQPPTAHGYDADDWTPDLVLTHIETTYDVNTLFTCSYDFALIKTKNKL